jgi:solute carrier family 40 (iron-regulated transporter), member 1
LKDIGVTSTATLSKVVSPNKFLIFIFFGALSLSRIGHFANLLMVQQLGQVEVPEPQRSTFAGTEESLKSLGELSHWVATIVWNSPGDFRWLAIGSLTVTGFSALVYRMCMATGEGFGSRQDYENVPLQDFEARTEDDIDERSINWS